MRKFIISILAVFSCLFYLGCDNSISPTNTSNIDTVFIFSKDTINISTKDTITISDSIYMFEGWENVLDSTSPCSYIIGLRDESEKELILIGSGAAINQNTILTNSHVYDGLTNSYILHKQAGYDVTPVAIQNGSSVYGNKVHVLDIGGYHNDWDMETVFTNDIGFVYTNEALPKYFTLSSNDTIRNICVGQEIGTIGFPGETSTRLAQWVTATFKDGIISALVPYSASTVPSRTNTYVIQHNFNTTGGTSGSPIFDNIGRLIGVNNSGAVKNIWDDVRGTFIQIPVGSVGYGIRADVVNEMFEQNNYELDTITSYYIPAMFKYYQGSRICRKNGTKPVYLGTTMAIAKAAADELFALDTLETGEAMYVSGYSTNGDFYFTDSCSFLVWFLKSSTSDNLWAIFIQWEQNEYSEFYLPAFSDYWGIAIGTSRSYILNSYGSTYTNTFSVDSSYYYYTYSTKGIAFGFDRSQGDWNCDGIQIAESGLMKIAASGSKTIPPPNIPKTIINNCNRSKAPKKPRIPVNKIFR